MNNYCVYEHINKLNCKTYVGITSQNPPNLRWGSNGQNYKKSNPYFWNAIQKYGWDNFSHVVVCSDLSKDQACKMEMKLIKALHTQNKEHGYNVLEGGNAPSMPQEIRDKLSVALIGNSNGLGHPCSEQKKQKISAAQKGRHLSEEHRQKLSEAKKGKPHKPCLEETKRKIANSHKKKAVYCKETNTIYESVQECARQLDLWAPLVTKCCKGKLHTTGGYHLEYINT